MQFAGGFDDVDADYFTEDAQTELIDPALVGTTSILKALKRSAPSVKRVIVTSSFASILDEAHFTDPNHTFSEKSWNPAGLSDIHKTPATAYRVSKTLAERAAWDFVANEKPGFDLVTVCPPLVLGPIVHYLATLDSINTSNERVVALVQGKWKEGIPTGGPVGQWVDVRDTARAHILAMEKPEAGGKRLFTTPGATSNHEIADIVRANFVSRDSYDTNFRAIITLSQPELSERLPGPDVKGGEAPASDQTFKINNDETVKILGIKWTTIEKSITDLVKSLKSHGI